MPQQSYHFLSKGSLLAAVVIGSALTCSLSPSVTAQISYGQEQNNTSKKEKPLEPSDLFLQAHVQFLKAQNEEQEEDFKLAWQSFSSALHYYQNLQLTQPQWNPSVVDHCIKKTTNQLERIKPSLDKQLAKERLSNLNPIEGNQGLQANDWNYKAPPELIRISQRIELLQEGLTNTKKHYERQQIIQQAHLATAQGQLKIWKNKNQKNPRIAARLEREIDTALAELDKNNDLKKSEEAKIQETIKRLRKELAKHSSAPLKAELAKNKQKLKDRSEDLRVVVGELHRLRGQQDGAKLKLATTLKNLKTEKKENARLSKMLEEQQSTSTAVVKSLFDQLKKAEKREQKLVIELRETKELLTDTSNKLDQQIANNNELQDKLTLVTAERDRLSDLMLKSPDERINKIFAMNKALVKDYEEATQTIKHLSLSQTSNNQRMVEAETNLAVAKQRIIKFQERNLQDARNIKDLRKKLYSIKNNATSSGDMSQAQIEENKILRQTAQKLLSKQMAQQRKLELLKEQMLAEEINPVMQELIKNNLRAEVVKLSDREKFHLEEKDRFDGEIFSKRLSNKPGVIGKNIERTEKELNAVHRVVKNLIKSNRYASAVDMLGYANDIQPNNFVTLMYLGNAHMQMQALEEAEKHFRNGIVMKKHNPYAHYMLGLCLYKMSRNNALAEKSLEYSLELDSSQEKAHFYLGAIAGEEGRYKKADEHLKNAIRINPELSEAYFALSTLSLLKQEMGKAQDYYQEALLKGYQPDIEHAEKLGLPH